MLVLAGELGPLSALEPLAGLGEWASDMHPLVAKAQDLQRSPSCTNARCFIMEIEPDDLGLGLSHGMHTSQRPAYSDWLSAGTS